jgi:cytochrome b561
LPNPQLWQMSASLGHGLLYVLTAFMATTGIAMGYFGMLHSWLML